MQSVVGIFVDQTAARQVVVELARAGLPADRITALMPGDPEGEIARVPTTEGEQPGIGRALGAVVGGAAGATTGVQVGALVGMFVPGIGPVVALGVLGAAVLGVGGAAVGGALEASLREGLPKDEVYLYEEALRSGRSVVVVLAADDDEADRARRIMREAGAESLDAAREQWWIGLRDAEEPWAGDEAAYRKGFEAGLGIDVRGRSTEEVIEELRLRYPDLHAGEAFQRGFARGRAWDESRRQQHRAA
jgi:hypothetical protein